MTTTRKTPAAKSPLDTEIYQNCRDYLPHGYFTEIAKRRNIEPYKVRRIMLGYFSESDGTHKAIRDEVLAKVSSIMLTKSKEMRRVSLQS
jgi:hypothetical protein